MEGGGGGGGVVSSSFWSIFETAELWDDLVSVFQIFFEDIGRLCAASVFSSSLK